MNRNADPGQSIAYLAMAGAKRSTGGDATLMAVPPLQAPSPREWLPAQIKTKETEAPQIYGAPIHKRLELEVMEPPLSPTTAQRAARRAAKGRGVTLSLTPAKRPVRVEWCMQPQVELPSITAHKSGAFSVTSTPLEEVPTAGQVDDCILAEHYTPCGALRATAPHAASQLHVHKLSSMLVMVKTVRLGELQTARQRHRAVTEWRLLRALRHKHIARLVHVMRDTDTDYVGASLSAIAETLLLVHEYCAGGSLEAYVTRYGALQVPPPPSPLPPSPPPPSPPPSPPPPSPLPSPLLPSPRPPSPPPPSPPASFPPFPALQERNAGRIVGQLNAALVHCHERQVRGRGRVRVRVSSSTATSGRSTLALLS